jgi:predicted Rossmann fold nucleotide-binding protein DprA/Smf involved in DNA uptake
MKLAVVGGREFKNYLELAGYIDYIRETRYIDTIISGGARGADRLAKRYAKKNHLIYQEYPADWNGPLKKGAGLARNTTVARSCDLMAAFWDGKSSGTKDVIEKAEKEGKEIYVYFF